MKSYIIKNVGCDDTTTFEIILDDEELNTIISFAIKNNKSKDDYCQPYIEIIDKKTNKYILQYGDEYD